MIRFENAKILSPEEIVDILEEECTSPAMERLFFIETKNKDEKDEKVHVWPCFIRSYATDKPKEEVKPPEVVKITGFEMYIVQSMKSQFGMLQVYVKTEELGVNKRIWDRPPMSRNAREEPWVPIVEGGVS